MAARKAKFDSSSADMIRQRDLDAQVVADAVDKHLRAQFEPELAQALSRAELCLHACNEYKRQLIDIQNKLKSTEDKLKDTESQMLDDA